MEVNDKFCTFSTDKTNTFNPNTVSIHLDHGKDHPDFRFIKLETENGFYGFVKSTCHDNTYLTLCSAQNRVQILQYIFDY